jgi:aerobic carbon-monoxide dehydrogenase small subunit
MTGIRLRINGAEVGDDVPPRVSLADFLRDLRNLTGTHLGCEHGVCGACTVLVDGEPARSCLMLTITIESASSAVQTQTGIRNQKANDHIGVG